MSYKPSKFIRPWPGAPMYRNDKYRLESLIEPYKLYFSKDKQYYMEIIGQDGNDYALLITHFEGDREWRRLVYLTPKIEEER